MTEDGLLVVDKPAGWTSHDVVARVRRLAGTRKVGHAGTLDPMATGVLVLGINRATKLLGHLTLSEKSYDATIRLGSSTTTDDAEGQTVSTADASGVSAGQVAAVACQVDPSQHHLPVPGGRECGDALDHRAGRERSARSSAMRDHAEGAAMVAAVLHLDKGAGVI